MMKKTNLLASRKDQIKQNVIKKIREPPLGGGGPNVGSDAWKEKMIRYRKMKDIGIRFQNENNILYKKERASVGDNSPDSKMDTG